jgi:hypothetical protein
VNALHHSLKDSPRIKEKEERAKHLNPGFGPSIWQRTYASTLVYHRYNRSGLNLPCYRKSATSNTAFIDFFCGQYCHCFSKSELNLGISELSDFASISIRSVRIRNKSDRIGPDSFDNHGLTQERVFSEDSLWRSFISRENFRSERDCSRILPKYSYTLNFEY